MSQNRKLVLELLSISELVNERIIDDLDRLDQIEKLRQWYEGFINFTQLHELAEHQLKQNIEAAALQHFTDRDFKAFRLHWSMLSRQCQRQILSELAASLKLEERNSLVK